jgi:uncharacterized protein
MAANIFLPPGFDGQRKYPAVVVVHPGGGVKEQTAGVYAQRLAERGFVTLAFDASHQGASGGLPRLLDDPMKRVGDIYSAVDYLTTLSYVDNSRIGALGICAGSGHTIKATTTDRRIKAMATVSAVDVGAAFRKGWDGKGSVAEQLVALEAAAKQRTAEAAGAAPVFVPYVPNVGDKTAPLDLQEAADYYLTPRGQHPNAPNKMLLTSTNHMMAYTGFEQVETLLTQPVMIITELLVQGASTIWPELTIDDYAERTEQTMTAWSGMNGQQGGDPAKLATALVSLSDSGALPLRFVAGADAIAAVEAKLKTIQEQIDAHRDLSASLALDKSK